MKVINRIKASQDFAQAIKKGRTYRSKSFIIHILKTNNSYARVGLSVSTKVGNAVVRNRVKRQIRSMCDEVIDYSTNTFDLVIIAKKDFLDLSYQDNKSQLSDLLLKQVGFINEK